MSFLNQALQKLQQASESSPQGSVKEIRDSVEINLIADKKKELMKDNYGP